MRCTADDYRAAADEFAFAAEIAMQRDHLDRDDQLILRFLRYSELMRHAAQRCP